MPKWIEKILTILIKLAIAIIHGLTYLVRLLPRKKGGRHDAIHRSH